MNVRPRNFSKSLLLWFHDTSAMTSLVLSVRMSIFRSSFFLDVTQRRLVFSYRLSGTTYRTEIHPSTLRNITAELICHLYRGGSFKSRNMDFNHFQILTPADRFEIRY